MLIIVAQETAPAVQTAIPPAPPVPAATEAPLQPQPISTRPKTIEDLVAEYVSGTGNRDAIAQQIYSSPIPRQRVLHFIGDGDDAVGQAVTEPPEQDPFQEPLAVRHVPRQNDGRTAQLRREGARPVL